nr:hypothetical protein [Tanacetum cinerariifolium]
MMLKITIVERLVAQGHTQEEGIDYDEVFAPVVRIEAIRLFLAFASFKEFMVYQIDVNSAFLYGKIEEEVCVCQPLGFEDLDFPDKVYKVEKALYGLHQAPRSFQVYVDDIIFRSIRKEMCIEFEKMMHKNFQISSMGELIFFLGLQVKQKEDRIFISQDKYVNEILTKFGFSDVKTASTPMKTHITLLKDEKREDVDEHLYRSMIRSLMYLTSLRHDIIFAVNPLRYPKDSPFDLVGYIDSDYAGASLDRNSTTGGFQFLGCRLISWQYKKHNVVANSITEAEYVAASSCCTAKVKNINRETQLHAKVDGKKVVISEASIRRDLWFEDEGGIDCLPNETIFEQLSLIGMVKNLDSATKFLMFPRFVQVFLNNQLEEMANHTRIYVPPSHTKKIFRNMKRVGNGFSGRDTTLFPTMMVQAQEELGKDIAILTETHPTPTITQPSTSKPLKKQKPRKPKRHDTEKIQPSGPITNVVDEAFNEENVPTHSNDLPLLRVNALGSGEDILKLKELIELCTKLTDRVLTLETTKIAKAKEIANLKKRVKRLERKGKSRTHGLKRFYKVRLSARVESSRNEESLDKEDSSKYGRIYDIDANQDIYLVYVHKDEDIFGVNDQDDTLMFDADKDLQGENVVFEEVNAATTPIISMDENTLAKALIEIKTSRPKAKGLAMQEPSETPTPRPIFFSQQPSKIQDKGKGIMIEEVNLAWDDVQAKIKADYEMAQRLQAEEQEKLTDAKKVKLFMEFLQKRRKFFAAKRAKEKRNKPVTKAQQISLTILDNGDDVTIDATPLSSKSPTIVDYKIYKEERKSFFKIIRTDGNSQMYLTFIKMLKNFDRKDLKVLWRLVKDRFVNTKPVYDMDSFLLHTLKTMFEHHVEDTVWKS